MLNFYSNLAVGKNIIKIHTYETDYIKNCINGIVARCPVLGMQERV